MHIVSSYRPGDLSSHSQTLRRESRGILLTAVYLAGMAAGSAFYLASGGVRAFAAQVLTERFLFDLPLSGILLTSMICVVGVCTGLFAAGVSMIGTMYVYVLTASVGSFSGIFFLSLYGNDVAMPAVRHVSIAIPFCICVSLLLMMGEYAVVMSRELKTGQGSREAEIQKKYALRQVILSLSAGLSICVMDLLVLLLRHIS